MMLTTPAGSTRLSRAGPSSTTHPTKTTAAIKAYFMARFKWLAASKNWPHLGGARSTERHNTDCLCNNNATIKGSTIQEFPNPENEYFTNTYG